MASERSRRLLLKALSYLVGTAVVAAWGFAAYQWGSLALALYLNAVEGSYAFLAPWVGHLAASAATMLWTFALLAVVGALVGTVVDEIWDLEEVQSFADLARMGLSTALIFINVAMLVVFMGYPIYLTHLGHPVFSAMTGSMMVVSLLAMAARILYLVVKIKGARVALSSLFASATALFLIWEMFITSMPMRLSGGQAAGFFGAAVGSWAWAYIEWKRARRPAPEAMTGQTFGLQRFDPPQ